jgi:hypothetical protein
MNTRTSTPAVPALLFHFLAAVAPSLGRLRREERGDVPGWVMITLMSALLVAGLLAIAGPQLGQLFEQAISRVSGLG